MAERRRTSSSSGIQNVCAPEDTDLVLVGTYNNFNSLAHEPCGNHNSSGVEVFSMQMDGTLLPMTQQKLDIQNPAFILKHHTRPDIFYVSSERIDENGEIVTMKLDRETGKLSILSRVDSGGKSTCYLTYLPGNKYLTAVHYWNAKLTRFRVREDGTLGEPCGLCQQGNGSYADEHLPGRLEHWTYRQKWSHAHCAVIDPYHNKHMFVCDLGQDKIMIYRTDDMTEQMKTAGEVQLETGIGPRHLVFHNQHKAAYVVNELVSSVSVYEYKDEGDVPTLTHRQTLTTLPSDWIEKKTSKNGVWKAMSHCSEIRIHPSGNFLYIGNRGHESLAIYRINHEDNGSLEFVDFQNTFGSTPRNFNFVGNERLVVGNQNSDSIVSFSVCEKSGKLTKQKSATCNSPNYILSVN